MNGEWPVLLDIMGKGEGERRYLSVAEVRTLFVDRRLPARIVGTAERDPRAGGGRLRGRQSRARLFARPLLSRDCGDHRISRSTRRVMPPLLAQLLPPPLPNLAADQGGALARPELVHGGQALVSPCQPGHRDFPGALCLVRRAGTAGHSSVYPARPAQR